MAETYSDNNPYNIESSHKLYVQWSHGDVPASYFENGKYPNGNESVWVWENIYIPVDHTVNGVTLTGHRYRREKVGLSGKWTVPIPLVPQSQISTIELIQI